MLRFARVVLPCMLAVLAPGCLLDRSAIDNGGSDAGLGDAGRTGRDASTPDAGPCVPGPELCNGRDDNCNGTLADDGADEETLGQPCDHPGDADLCADGTIVCVNGALACNDDGDQPDERELCDGLDNDCNPDTPDGAHEVGFGQPCDGDDNDLCAGGTWVCTGSGLVCADDGDRPDEIERCDGIDNDCDPSTPDGMHEGWFGEPCDDPADADLCAGGVASCVDGARTCVGDDGDRPEEVERCDGVDNDCNPATPDGSAEPWLGQACDSPDDLDLCPEGTLACVSGAMTCTGDDGDQPGEREICDGVDNDCNPATPDGAAEVGERCDGPDSDLCREGMATACVGGTLTCTDMTGNNVETCNGQDDDCDGTVDEGANCGCAHRTFQGRAYLFCDTTRSWYGARGECRALGYELVSITSEAEQLFVRDQAHSIRNAGWWIGANDDEQEGRWEWSGGGGLLTYTAWQAGEPNNSGITGEDCGVMQTSAMSASGVAGGWNDTGCLEQRRYICESRPASAP